MIDDMIDDDDDDDDDNDAVTVLHRNKSTAHSIAKLHSITYQNNHCCVDHHAAPEIQKCGSNKSMQVT